MSAPRVVREAAGAEGVRIEPLRPASTPGAQASPQRKSAKEDEKRG
ncbi:MAG: hypothetical protein O7A71_02315 [Chloroflexi bacterium]|nr:hypothetical protein [Chloroflexota bacterium]